jgi:hypothetical protein
MDNEAPRRLLKRADVPLEAVSVRNSCEDWVDGR